MDITGGGLAMIGDEVTGQKAQHVEPVNKSVCAVKKSFKLLLLYAMRSQGIGATSVEPL